MVPLALLSEPLVFGVLLKVTAMFAVATGLLYWSASCAVMVTEELIGGL